MAKHILPELPYARDALEPYISAETIDFHYSKHHASYVDKLNAQVEGTEFADASLEDIISTASGGIFNNGSQVWNHTFYWNCLSPNGGGQPAGDFPDKLSATFGSVDKFRKFFDEAATTNFGSGWTWLCANHVGELEIINTGNADNPLRNNKVSLLTCDMWEHAYYIDYRHSRPSYLDAFWRVVNWGFVAENYCRLG